MSFRVAVVGTGRMGKLHARVLSQMENAELVCVVDSDEATANDVAGQRDCKAFTDVNDAVDLVDAAIVAVPTLHHLDAARPFIEAGKSVLIEKPFTDDVKAGRKLIRLAEKTGASLQVGHTERFNPLVVAMQKYDIHAKFIEAHRISPFTFRSADIGVVLDMMIHDIDLTLMLAEGSVESLHAVGINVLGEHEDICSVRLVFDNGCCASISGSRLAIKTERKMRVFSENAYLSLDYGKKVGVVIQKAKNLDLIQMAREMEVDDLAELASNVDYKELVNAEDLVIDDSLDPLTRQAEAFRRTVVDGEPPVVSAEDGLAAVQVANDIVKAIRNYRWDGKMFGRKGLDQIQKEEE
jgi:predicted dehydrogenase